MQLDAVRQAIIGTGICRTGVNRRVRLIVQAFKWAVAKRHVPPVSPHRSLQAVSGLLVVNRYYDVRERLSQSSRFQKRLWTQSRPTCPDKFGQ